MTIAGVKVPSQVLGEVLAAPDTAFDELTFDGLVGMAFAPLAQIPNNPIISQMIQRKLLSPGIFSFWLSPQVGNRGGALTLGGYNSKYYEGPIKWMQLTSAAYWSVKHDHILVGKTKILGGTRAILDTGTSLIMGPPKAVNRLHKLIGAYQPEGEGEDSWAVDCNRVASLPTITFVLDGGKQFPLEGHDYIIESEGICLTGFAAGDLTNDEDEPAWLVGDAFLRAWYSIHDMDQERIGLAKAVTEIKNDE